MKHTAIHTYFTNLPFPNKSFPVVAVKKYKAQTFSDFLLYSISRNGFIFILTTVSNTLHNNTKHKSVVRCLKKLKT